ncbi:hypothetical protein [Stutzerimonas nitrititolerans]|uniref:hypothetical protein n=1 Tax=Stutzerimonas nitrititolerans TaxID=2482751 RepID=UPI0028B154CA|nr:hypothetical protein [Stutzerimonas nitrititolerans]
MPQQLINLGTTGSGAGGDSARAETWTLLIEQNPTASPSALRAMLDKLHPPA